MSQNHWLRGVSLLFLMICSAIFVMYESFIDAWGVFQSGVKCSSNEPFWFHFPLPFHVPPTHPDSMLCFKIVSWFPLSCAFSPFLMSSVLHHAVVFRYIYFSFVSHWVSVFESRLCFVHLWYLWAEVGVFYWIAIW